MVELVKNTVSKLKPFTLEWLFMFIYVFDGHSKVHHGLS